MKMIKILGITLGLASIGGVAACTDIYTTESTRYRVHHYPAPYYPYYPARPIYPDPIPPAPYPYRPGRIHHDPLPPAPYPYYPSGRIHPDPIPAPYPSRRIHHSPACDDNVKHIPEAAPYSAPGNDRIKHIPG